MWETAKAKEVKGRTHFVLFIRWNPINFSIWEDKAWRAHLKKCKRLRLLQEQEELLIQTLPHIQQGKFFELGMKEARVLPNSLEWILFLCNFWSCVCASKVITSSNLKSTTAACARHLCSLVRAHNKCWEALFWSRLLSAEVRGSFLLHALCKQKLRCTSRSCTMNLFVIQ